MLDSEKCNQCKDSFINHNDVMSILACGFCCYCKKSTFLNNISGDQIKNTVYYIDIGEPNCFCGNQLTSLRFGKFCSSECRKEYNSNQYYRNQ